ncbi:L-rhamnose isomerase [candidate division WOR-3 bacterium]|nr:L-rhamnose isomerase [candidate division WOR-3 bacterium]
MEHTINGAYESARDNYARLNVDTDKVLELLGAQAISIQCWQGDDVRGFEKMDSSAASGGIQATGSYPGKARTIHELQQDLEKALTLIPGTHRINIHAMYGEFHDSVVDRDAIEKRHFQGWIDWARALGLGLDFNATLFRHPKADSGFTLSSKDPGIRRFWVEHVKQCRSIGAAIGKELSGFCIHDLWIPDGMKDTCIDKYGYRALLKRSLDDIYAVRYDDHLKDAVESKLFGIGSESFVAGSHEFYLGYAITHDIMVCLDMGHFHPTESIADKITAILQFSPGIMLHVSRGVRWDSDHVAVLDDQLRDVTQALVRAQALDRAHIALDYFDASINRISAWVIGARATLKALLYALLEPTDVLIKHETTGDYTARLALLEELKTLPFNTVWDRFCLLHNVPFENAWLNEVRHYEREVLLKRT